MARKRITLSFDDGRRDFYQFVYPYLRQKGIKATLNVTTGYIDRSVPAPFNPCSIEEIKEMTNYGIDMALHGDKHLEHETPEDMDQCLQKLRSWGVSVKGVGLPYNQTPTEELARYFAKEGLSYYRIGDRSRTGKIHYGVTLLLGKSLAKPNIYLARQKMNIYTPHPSKTTQRIYSTTVVANRDIDIYLRLLKKMKFGQALTLVFHTVSDEQGIAHSDFPIGAWPIERFICFVDAILQDPSFEIVPQNEIF